MFVESFFLFDFGGDSLTSHLFRFNKVPNRRNVLLPPGKFIRVIPPTTSQSSQVRTYRSAILQRREGWIGGPVVLSKFKKNVSTVTHGQTIALRFG